MSTSNGRQKRAIENLATALNECFDAATERAAERAVVVSCFSSWDPHVI